MALHHYVPQDRLRALALGHELPERTQGAALFADISGFTALTETLRREQGERRGIDSLSRRVNEVYDALIAAVEARQGSVIGFAGDAITCWFDEAQGPASRRAALAARGMQAAMARFPDLAVKVSVATGPARRFAVGDPDIQRVDALAGATLTRVALGEALAQAGEVLVDAATAAALGLSPGDARTGPASEAFTLLPPATALPDDGLAAPTPAAPPPDARRLRPWVLPFVFERETAGRGLFVTDLRPASAMFVRMTGLDYDHDDGAAAALIELIARTQRVLQQHGGVLLELNIGDKGSYLYGCFGAAQVHEDDPARAVRAALAVRRALHELGVALQVGISCGTMRVGGYGGRTRQSFGAIGDEVNTAARLMMLAQPGEILIAARVHHAIGDEFVVEPRLPLPMKGKAEPMPVFAVVRAPQRRAIRLQEPAATTPLVGRAAEMALIHDGIAAALQGQGRLIALAGEAGMGKSRLVAEGVRRALARRCVGYGGSCRMDGVRTPYLVWQSIWTAFFDVDPGLPLRRQLLQAQAVLAQHVPQHAEAWPLLGTVLGQAWPDNDFTRALEPKDRKSLLEAVLLQCLASAAREAAHDGVALLLVLEDLHAADPSSLDLLAQVARAVPDLPVLMLLSLRSNEATQSNPALQDLGTQLQALPQYRQIELAALAPAEVEQVIRARLAALFPERSGAVPPALIERITERAQGNPFYVEELLNFLHDRGLDPRHSDAARALELPASLHSLVLSRTDQLPVGQQLALKAASVIGRLFRDADLMHYCPELGAPDRVAQDLAALDRLGLTPQEPSEPEASHLFRHRVTQEVAYESIAYATRLQLHGHLADHLERRHADQLGTLAATLAHHFECAGRDDKAAHYLQLAADQAAARYANDEALALYGRALQRLPADAAAARAAVMLRSEGILALQGRHAPRGEMLAALDALTGTLPPTPAAVSLQAQVAVRQARLAIDTGRYAEAGRWARAAIDRLEGQGPPTAALAEQLVDALHQQARAAFFAGQAQAARADLERALALARDHRYLRGETNVLSLLGLAHWQGGELERADTLLREALVLVGQLGDARRQLAILNNLGVVAKTRGLHGPALAHYDAALSLARRIGDRPGEAMLLNNMGDVCLEQGDFHQASRHAAAAARIYEEAREPVSRGAALINSAEASRGLGQLDTAQAVALQALALLRDGGHRRGEAVVTDNLGLIAFAQGRLPEAVSHAREALALARDIEAPVLVAGIQRNLGRALTAADDWAAAEATLQEAATAASALDAGTLPLELQAARAELALACGAPGGVEQSVALLEEVLPRLLSEAQPGAAGLLPLWVHAVAWRALDAAADPRAAALRAAAQHELARRARFVPDEAARQAFLRLPEHAALGGPAADA